MIERDVFSCTVKEGKLLRDLAMFCDNDCVVVEIGSWKGYSTIWLARGSRVGDEALVYAIDTFEGDIHNYVSGEGSTYQEFKKNITEYGIEEYIVPIIMKSEEAEKGWDKPIGLLFIDGDHEDIENDFNRWFPHVEIGGVVALHDTVYGYDMLPYKVAVRELYKSGKFADVKRVGCITYGRKVSELSTGQRIRNRIALYGRYIYQLYIPCYTKCLTLGVKVLRRSK